MHVSCAELHLKASEISFVEYTKWIRYLVLN